MHAASTNTASHFHSDSFLYYLFCAFLETKKKTMMKGRSSDLLPMQTSSRKSTVTYMFTSSKATHSSGTVQDSHLIPF